MFGRYLFLLTAPLIALIVAISWFLHESDDRHEVAAIASEERAVIDLEESNILEDFSRLAADLQFLAHLHSVRGLIHHLDEASALKQVQQEFDSFATSHPVYDQLRIIDAAGVERVRVNLSASGIGRATEDLQDKSGRYYFQQTAALAPQQIYFSPLDLNVEHGEIEKPLKPVIRCGTPIHDGSGHLSFVIVLNFLASNLLDHLQPMATGVAGQILLSNREGYWLKGPTPQDEWGFMAGMSGSTVEERFPNVWRAIEGLTTGKTIQIQNGAGLFTIRHVQPLRDLQRLPDMSTGQWRLDTPRQWHDYRWTLVSFVPDQILHRKSHEILPRLVFIDLTLIAVIGLIALFISEVLAERKDHLQRIKENERRMQTLFDGSFDAIITADIWGRIESINAAACQLFGLSEHKAVGESAEILIPPDLRAEFAKGLEQFRSASPHKAPVNVVWTGVAYHQSGRSIPVELGLSEVEVRGQPVLLAVIRDITERRALEKHLRDQALTDHLTGLHNRRYLEQRLDEEIKQLQRYGGVLSLLLIDVDWFKSVNDEYGHLAGDAYLQGVAKRLLEMARITDVLCRYGGEELVFILPHTDGAAAHLLAGRLRVAIEGLVVRWEGDEIQRTISIGVTTAADHFEGSGEELMRQGDVALYRAKESGRNRVEIYAPHLDDAG